MIFEKLLSGINYYIENVTGLTKIIIGGIKLKKAMYFMLMIMILSVLAIGCTPAEVEDVSSNVEKQSDVGEKEAEKAAEEETEVVEKSKDEVIDVNKEIANDDKFRAELKSVKKINDEIFGNSIEITFELENKMDQKIEVQAREVSADGKMVDESTLSMSQEITPGKIADGKLTIMDFEGNELPELKENLEMKLHVFSWDDMDLELDYPVEISFK